MEGTITITLKEGGLSVSGPLDNPILCYAMLEGARDVIFMKSQKRQRTGLVVPGPEAIIKPS